MTDSHIIDLPEAHMFVENMTMHGSYDWLNFQYLPATQIKDNNNYIIHLNKDKNHIEIVNHPVLI